MASVVEWVEGARPRTLPAAVAPVIAGLGVTGYTGTALSGSVVALNAGLALLVSLALQVGVNYFNDYSDGVRGTDKVRVGPVRLVGQGLAPARQVRHAAVLSLVAAALFGAVLVLVSREWVLLPVGAAAVLAAYGYTGGSRPYGYYGLGEVFVFIFFGPVAVCGTTLVTGGGLWPISVLTSVAIGLLTVAILVANNLRDRPLDAEAGKHTLAVRLGERNTRLFYAGCQIAALALIAGIALGSTLWALLGLVGGLPALAAARKVLQGAAGPALIPVLQLTSLALLLAGLGLGLGFVL
ncbi:MAG: 1,4-dihydroxy-2-naphthoate polyprenyltransferase [Candidatus Nanopelagicales bacterium]